MSAIASERKLFIENAVDRIKLDTGLSYPENSLLEIATALDAEVVSANLPDFQGKKVKGLIQWYTEAEKEKQRTDNGHAKVAKIYLNSNQSDIVANFTLAHELGHLLLHKNSNNFRIDLQDYSPEGDPENQETEANYFAGSLLMPREKLFIALNNAKSLDEVAQKFAVSKPAIEARLKWLGLVN